MAKRHITQKQYHRIELRMQKSDHLNRGLVISRFNRNVLIETPENTIVMCRLKPNLAQVVAGDQVFWQPEGDNQGTILQCQPRHSLLGRPDKYGKYKTIAANVTQMLIVIAPKPEPIFTLLDSYLVAAEHLNLTATIILNKNDLKCATLQHTITRIYHPLKYSLLSTGLHDSQGYHALCHALHNQSSVVVGQSGVGKSSLIQKILPNEAIFINTLSQKSHQGQHTTVHSKLYHLPFNGTLIDSPGIREFGLWKMTYTDIALGFPEFRAYLNQCKYRNCQHNYQHTNQTPGCALIRAVEKHQIHPQRLQNYVKLCESFT